MSATQTGSLWSDLWTDLQDPGYLVQAAVLVLCLALGWGLARLLRSVLARHTLQPRAMRLGVESFVSVLSPLLALGLIAIAKLVMMRWHHVNLLRVAIPLLGSFALIRLAFYFMRRVFAREGRAGNVLLLFERSFAILVWIGVALYLTGLWPDLVQYLNDTVVPLGRHPVSLLVIFQAAASVVVTLVLAMWASALLEERLMRIDTIHSSLRAVLGRVGRAILILIAVLVSLSLVGIDLTVLSVFGGALGVGIGLGLQKIVSSYVSGFVILLERSLSIGDMVSVDKYYGRVTQINTRYTVLQGLDGVESVVPNDMLVSGAIQNHSLTDRTLRLATQVTVAFQTDVEPILRMLEQAVSAIPRVSKDLSPSAALVKLGADGLELELGFWITDPENGRQNVLSDVNLAVWAALQANQIKVPYPQREIRMIDAAAP